MAASKVATRKSWSMCDSTSQVAYGTSSNLPAVKEGCSSLGKLECASSSFWSNSTAGLQGCPAPFAGYKLNVTGKCQPYDLTNYTLTCEDIDGTQAADVTLYAGNNCNSTATPLGVFSAGTCYYVTDATWGKMWMNTTGSYVATYSAAGCASQSQSYIVKLAATGTSGCAVGGLSASSQSVKWALLEAPTSAPTAATNGTNTTAPASSSTVVVASLASVVVAAASMMF